MQHQPLSPNSRAGSLYGLSTLKGQWTRARLKKHFTEQQITAALTRNVLTEDRTGTIRAVPGKTRLLEQGLQPGETVVQMIDGHPVEMMVVQDEQGRVQLVNPAAPNEPQKEAQDDELIRQEELANLKEIGIAPTDNEPSGMGSNPLMEALDDPSQFTPENRSQWNVQSPFAVFYWRELDKLPDDIQALIINGEVGREAKSFFKATMAKFNAGSVGAGLLVESLLEGTDTGPRGFSDSVRAATRLAQAAPHDQGDEPPDEGNVSGLESTDPILRQAVGHFFKGWKEDDAPAILNPWKHNYTSNRQLDLYPQWSEFMLDREMPIVRALQGSPDSETFWQELEDDAQSLISQYD